MRPFLGIGKADLLCLPGCERGIAFSTDSTNASTDYLRNRIRRDLVPALDSSLPGMAEGPRADRGKGRRAMRRPLSAAAATHSLRVLGRVARRSFPLRPAPSSRRRDAVASGRSYARPASCSGRRAFPPAMAAAALERLRGGEGSAYRGSRSRAAHGRDRARHTSPRP